MGIAACSFVVLGCCCCRLLLPVKSSMSKGYSLFLPFSCSYVLSFSLRNLLRPLYLPSSSLRCRCLSRLVLSKPTVEKLLSALKILADGNEEFQHLKVIVELHVIKCMHSGARRCLHHHHQHLVLSSSTPYRPRHRL